MTEKSLLKQLRALRKEDPDDTIFTLNLHYSRGYNKALYDVERLLSEAIVSYPKLEDKKGNVGWKAHISLVEQWFEERFAGLESSPHLVTHSVPMRADMASGLTAESSSTKEEKKT